MNYIFYSLWRAIVKTINHGGVEHAGYMSFMIILSIFPFFVFILALASFLGFAELGEEFIEMTVKYIPDEAIESFKSQIRSLTQTPPQSLLTIAVAGTIWTSSSFVECLRTILNRVYEIKSPPNYILRRLLSIGQFLMMSFAIMASMVLLVLVPIILAKIPNVEPLDTVFTYIQQMKQYSFALNIVRYGSIFTILFLSTSTIYYIIPNARISFREVLPGAFICVFLWTSCGYLLSKYIKFYNQLNIVYGSLGSIIITLMFFFVVNMLFIYGAEFNYLLKNKPRDQIND